MRSMPPLREMIRSNVSGCSFIDIAGLWQVKGEKVTAAMQGGASRVVMLDELPQGHPYWEQLRQRLRNAGLSPEQCEYISRDVDRPGLEAEVGRFDFVNCNGLLYHCPNPMHTILQVCSVAGNYLTFQTNIVPRRIENEAGSLTIPEAGALFVPALTEVQLQVVSRYFELRGGRLLGRGETSWIDEGSYDYGPWWWLYSHDIVLRMIELAGLRILQTHVGEDDKHIQLFAQRARD